MLSVNFLKLMSIWFPCIRTKAEKMAKFQYLDFMVLFLAIFHFLSTLVEPSF